MTDALVSFVVEELGAIVKDEVGLLADVKNELERLSRTFSTIQALLVDAERKQVTKAVVRVWLGKIKDVAYEVEDILDEWRTDAFMSQHDEDEDEDDSVHQGAWEKSLYVEWETSMFEAGAWEISLDIEC